MPAPPKPRALLLLALLCVFGWAAGQEPATVAAEARGDTVLVEVASLARALGVVAHVDGNVLTWRGPNGPVTLFGGTPDALAHLPGDGHRGGAVGAGGGGRRAVVRAARRSVVPGRGVPPALGAPPC